MRFLIVMAALFMPLQANAQAVCETLNAQKQGAADYVAGVDVYGNAVTSADLNPSPQPITEPVIVPIEVDLAARYNREVPDGVRLMPSVAGVAIFPDGRVLYNGTDVSQQFATVCNGAEEVQGVSNDTLVSGDAMAEMGAPIDGQFPALAPVPQDTSEKNEVAP